MVTAAIKNIEIKEAEPRNPRAVASEENQQHLNEIKENARVSVGGLGYTVENYDERERKQ